MVVLIAFVVLFLEFLSNLKSKKPINMFQKESTTPLVHHSLTCLANSIL
jgi:hypothetical protein